MRHHGSGLASASAEVIEFEGRRFRDPFDIPASLSRKIPTALYPCIFRIIKAKYARVIRRGLRKPGARALLLCDRKVVATAQTPEGFELQEIRRIEHERDRVCFTYSEEDLVEECAWRSMGGLGLLTPSTRRNIMRASRARSHRERSGAFDAA
jgi:hypothetical protein